MTVSSVLGIVGIGMLALDREVLSGVNNTAYAAALRCAPEFVAFIEIRRTPLIYIGYLTFSFGFASMVLYLTRAEDLRGWPSYLAQASIISPVGYAMLYSGRMPILLMLALVAGAVVVRVRQGRTWLPRGHYLLLKFGVLVLAFGLYTNAMWSIRQNFCTKMAPVIVELRDIIAKSPVAEKRGDDVSAGMISAGQFAALLKKEMDVSEETAGTTSATSAGYFFDVMQKSWGVSPRPYVLSAVEKGVSPSRLISVLSNYMYLTHGVMTLDRIMAAHERLNSGVGHLRNRRSFTPH